MSNSYSCLISLVALEIFVASQWAPSVVLEVSQHPSCLVVDSHFYQAHT